MKTPNLDKYIFQSFEKTEGLKVKSISGIIESQNKLDLEFFKSLFENLEMELKEEIIKQPLFKKKYKYHFQLTLNSILDKQDYVLFLGKMSILCGKLYAEIKTFGINM